MRSHQSLQFNSSGFFLTSPLSMFLNLFSRETCGSLSPHFLGQSSYSSVCSVQPTTPALDDPQPPGLPAPTSVTPPAALCTTPMSPDGHSTPRGRKGQGRRAGFGQNTRRTARKRLVRRPRAGCRAERELRAEQEWPARGRRPGSGLRALHRWLVSCSYPQLSFEPQGRGMCSIWEDRAWV